MSTTDAERDERLRKARDWAERLRESLPRLPGGPTAFEETVLALADEVTRLDAVVTAVREMHVARLNSMSALHPKPLCSCGDEFPCPTVRALDGGAR